MLIAIMTHLLSHLITIQRRLIFYALAIMPMKFAIGISTRFHVSGFSRLVSGCFSSLLQCVSLSPMRKVVGEVLKCFSIYYSLLFGEGEH